MQVSFNTVERRRNKLRRRSRFQSVLDAILATVAASCFYFLLPFLLAL